MCFGCMVIIFISNRYSFFLIQHELRKPILSYSLSLKTRDPELAFLVANANHDQDFDGAMSQYLRTVGYVEPSYVIRKFLDAQRIHNLTEYLEGLHEKGKANSDHTTLLLNCYTKLKDVNKLDSFLRSVGSKGRKLVWRRYAGLE